MIEKQKQSKLAREKKKIEKSRSILKESKERLKNKNWQHSTRETRDKHDYFLFRLTKSISKLEHFRKFLESAVNQSGGEFLEVKQMIDRIMILVEIRLLFSSTDILTNIFFRNSLRDRAVTLEKTTFTMKTELDCFVLKTEKESIASQGNTVTHSFYQTYFLNIYFFKFQFHDFREGWSSQRLPGLPWPGNLETSRN